MALELWNEPLQGSWAQATGQQPGYNRAVPAFNALALAVGSRLRAAAPLAALLAPGATLMVCSPPRADDCSRCVFTPRPLAQSNDAFLASFAQSGVLRYLAGFSVHPYRDCQWPERGLADWRQLRAILDAVPGGSSMPLVSSEWGYSALWPTPAMKALADPRFDQPASTGCNEELQAKFVPRMRGWQT